MEEDCRERTNGLQEARRWMGLQESARMGLSPHAQAKSMSYNCWHLGSSSTILLSCNEIVPFYVAFWLHNSSYGADFLVYSTYNNRQDLCTNSI